MSTSCGWEGSASAVVIHYEEALYQVYMHLQVYAPLPDYHAAIVGQYKTPVATLANTPVVKSLI